MNNKKLDLNERLVKFAFICFDVCDLLPDKKSSNTFKDANELMGYISKNY
jgi:hypothetical protein